MIDDILDKVQLHRQSASMALKEIKEWDGLNTDIFKNFEKIKTIDTFIYRFIRFQDMVSDKLFKIYLNDIGEYKDNMSLLDILDKLEKFEIIDESIKWMEYRKLRNKLTHEYPNNEQDVIDGIKIAIDAFCEIEHILEKIIVRAGR